MSCHVSMTLQADDALARVVVRLHAVRGEIDEMHFGQRLLCLHLSDASREPRVRAVLDRLVDVEVLVGAGPCVALGPRSADLPTTYLVWAEPLPARAATRKAAAHA